MKRNIMLYLEESVLRKLEDLQADMRIFNRNELIKKALGEFIEKHRKEEKQLTE